jgi:hypothetical protein
MSRTQPIHQAPTAGFQNGTRKADQHARTRRQREAERAGGHNTSDAGRLLLREVEKHHRRTRRWATVLHDPRAPEQDRHKRDTQVRQRGGGDAAGNEEYNDHEALRYEQALQTALGEEETLAGKSTQCREEQNAERQAIVKAQELLWHHFNEQHDEPPKENGLDFDGTDIPGHGEQPGKFFNRYYEHHCYFPLYVFCGRHLLVSYLRTSDRSDSRHSWANPALLVRLTRQTGPIPASRYEGKATLVAPGS